MRNSCQSAIQNAAVRILSTSVLVRPALTQWRDFMKTAVGQQRRNVFCPDSSKKSQSSTSNSEKPGTSITRSRELRRQIPARSRHTRKMAPEARQVLIWGLPVDPIFADGAAKLRSRAAPSARIEPQVLCFTDLSWLVKF